MYEFVQKVNLSNVELNELAVRMAEYKLEHRVTNEKVAKQFPPYTAGGVNAMITQRLPLVDFGLWIEVEELQHEFRSCGRPSNSSESGSTSGTETKASMGDRMAEIASYIIDNHATITEASEHFSVSKSTVARDMQRLRDFDLDTYELVKVVQEENRSPIIRDTARRRAEAERTVDVVKEQMREVKSLPIKNTNTKESVAAARAMRESIARDDDVQIVPRTESAPTDLKFVDADGAPVPPKVKGKHGRKGSKIQIKGDIDRRKVVEMAKYYLSYDCTYRDLRDIYGISAKLVARAFTQLLPDIDSNLYKAVKQRANEHSSYYQRAQSNQRRWEG